MKGMQDLSLHFFLTIDLRGIKAGMGDHLFRNSASNIGTGDHALRCAVLIRDPVDAGICPKEADVVGVADTGADLLIHHLDPL